MNFNGKSIKMLSFAWFISSIVAAENNPVVTWDIGLSNIDVFNLGK